MSTKDLIRRLTAPKIPATKLGRSLAQLGLREITPVEDPGVTLRRFLAKVETQAELRPRLTHEEWRAAPGAPSFLHPGWGF